MFFRLFNLPKNKPNIIAINLILLVCFIITINGCTTTSTSQYPKEYLPLNERIKILSITLKNGTFINTKYKDVLYKDNYENINKVLLIMPGDSTIMGKEIHLQQTSTPGVYDTTFVNTQRIIKSNKAERIIPLNDVLEVFIEKEETDVCLTILATIGIIAGLVVIVGLIAVAAKQSCPFMYSFNGEKYVFDGEPLGGAICDGLTRTDYSRMENLKPSDGKFKLLIRNEADEKQFLDEIKLLIVPCNEKTFVTPNPEGEFFNYKSIIIPESVTDENGKDVSMFFKEKDNVKWQTQMPYDTSFRGGVERHNLKFRFPKPEGAKNALLFANCGTALWGSYMIKAMLQLRGNKVDEWYKNVNSGGIEMMKLYQFMEREELYTLKVNLLEGDKYKAKTYIPAGGPLLDEDKIIRLPLDNVAGDFVDIILNPPAGYWKIDQIGIIYDYKVIGKDKIQELDAVYAIDQDGKDFKNDIRNIDKKYYKMPEIGNTSNVYYNLPQGFDRTKNEIFLKTTGYYEVHVDKEKSEEKTTLEEILATSGKIIQYSMELYNQKIKGITENKTFDGIKIEQGVK
jgi:hypothetical protein